jgi:hypothetical protein
MIKESKQVYDYIIITRNQYIDSIKKYEDLFEENIKKGIYIRRNDPYMEDRVIYGTPEHIIKLGDIYSELPKMLKDSSIAYPEGILKDFILRNFSNDIIYNQKSIQPIGTHPVNAEFKRTTALSNIVDNLYNEYEIMNMK